MIPATLIFHTDFYQRIQEIQFMKNLGLMGGLLMVADFGSGPLSWDAGVPSLKTSGKLTVDESGANLSEFRAAAVAGS